MTGSDETSTLREMLDWLHATLRVLNTPPSHNRVPKKWDGHAGERIADVLLAWLSGDRISTTTRTAV